MRRVRCYECGKIYNFDVDDFCPRCGAFNQPPKSSAIDASGAVIRVDGINERGHTGSFAHEEFHEENRERKRMGLSKGVRRVPQRSRSTAVSGNVGTSRPSRSKNPVSLIFKIIAAILLFNVVCEIVFGMLFW